MVMQTFTDLTGTANSGRNTMSGPLAWAPRPTTGAVSPFAPIPGATPGSTVSTSGSTSTTTPVSGPNGPFSSLTAPLTSSANAGLRAGQQILDTSMDPQNALRGREEQRLQDQARVNAAARGITPSPYGAGLENTAMSNFDIDWQNNQLARQLTGIQGNAAAMVPAESLYGQQFGSTTTESGYRTTPPTPQQPGGGGGSPRMSGGGGGGAAPAGGGPLAFPDMGGGGGMFTPMPMPTIGAAPQSIGPIAYPGGPEVGLMTPQGVDYNTIIGNIPQSNPMDMFTPGGYVPPDTTGQSGFTPGASMPSPTNAIGQPVVDTGMGMPAQGPMQGPTMGGQPLDIFLQTPAPVDDASAQQLIDQYFA